MTKKLYEHPRKVRVANQILSMVGYTGKERQDWFYLLLATPYKTLIQIREVNKEKINAADR